MDFTKEEVELMKKALKNSIDVQTARYNCIKDMNTKSDQNKMEVLDRIEGMKALQEKLNGMSI